MQTATVGGHFLWLLTCILVLLYASFSCEAKKLSIHNEVVGVTINVSPDGLLSEFYSVATGSNTWTDVLFYAGPAINVSTVDSLLFVTWTNLLQTGPLELTVLGKGPCGLKKLLCLYQRTVSLVNSSMTNDKDELMAVSVSHTALSNTGEVIPLSTFEDWYTFLPEQLGGGPPADFAWSQSIKHMPTAVVPHWQFKFPTVILQQGSILAALVADLPALTGAILSNQPPYMNLVNNAMDGAALCFGLGQTTLTFHSIYSLDPHQTIAWKKQLNLQYHIVLSGAATQFNATKTASFPLGWQILTKLLWKWFGYPAIATSPGQQTNFQDSSVGLFDVWRQTTWYGVIQNFYLEFPCEGNSAILCATIRSDRNDWADHNGTDNDAWFNAWFENLRTAYGMSLYASRVGDARLAQQAAAVLRLALYAPQNSSGPFPSIFWLGTDNVTFNWFDDSGWAGLCRVLPPDQPPPHCMNFYHLYDNTWTGHWMLRWLKILNTSSPIEAEMAKSILQMTTLLGDFIVSVQLDSGVIPRWFNQDTLKASPYLAKANSETASDALFLLELYEATGYQPYLRSGLKALDYIVREVIPKRLWWDYETFLSCSNKPFNFYDPWTSQVPENNLAKLVAALAFAKAYEVTKSQAYLDVGQIVVDYNSMTQIVFNHPLLSPALVGGFTTQNTDAEWSDARQAHAAEMYFTYYRLTNKTEYLQRGVGALRSSFAVAPYENWATTACLLLVTLLFCRHIRAVAKATLMELLAVFIGVKEVVWPQWKCLPLGCKMHTSTLPRGLGLGLMGVPWNNSKLPKILSPSFLSHLIYGTGLFKSLLTWIPTKRGLGTWS
jgi:hypothetical protein